MDYPIETKTLTILGVDCLIGYFQDQDADAPWDMSEGHGPVRKTNTPHWRRHAGKKPGERPLNQADRNEYQFYYDWQEAIKLAKRDGWNTEPYDAPNRVARAVQADFDFLRGYVNGNWEYVGIVCTILDADGEKTDVADSCWGCETFGDYHLTSGTDMATELVNGHLRAKREAWRAALHEARERKYWACRDVETTGA